METPNIEQEYLFLKSLDVLSLEQAVRLKQLKEIISKKENLI